MSTNFRFVLGLLIGAILIIIWLAYFVEVDEMSVYLKQIDLPIIGLVVFFYVAAYLCRSRRWQIILQPIQSISYLEVTSLFFGGMFINYLFPIRAGELAKSVFLKRTKGIRIANSLPTILLNKALDLVPILLVLGMFPFMAIRTKMTMLILCGVLLLALATAAGILILSIKDEQLVIRILKKIFFWLPAKLKEKIFDFIDRFVVAVAMTHLPFAKWAQLFILTFLAVGLEAAYFGTLFYAFHYKMSIAVAIFGYTLMNLSYILPTPPAQIGSKELVALFIFSYSFGIDENLVGAVTAFAHLLTGFLICLLGASSLGTIGIQLTDLIQPLENENEKR